MVYPAGRPQTADILFSDLEKPHRQAIWQKKAFIAAGIFSFIWALFVMDFLAASGWWGDRYDLSPVEFAGGLCGLFLPVVIAFLVSAYFDRSAQLAYEAQTLQSYLNELVYPTQEGAVYTKTLTDALRTQIKEFRTVFDQVNEQTQQVRDDLKHWIGDLGQVINHVDTQTIESVREIAEHIHNLAEVTELANAQAEQASKMFAGQTDELKAVGRQTVESLTALSTNLSMHSDDLKNITHAIETSNDRTEHALERAGSVVNFLQEQSVSIEQSIDDYEESAKQQNARLFGNLEKVLSVFKAHGALLEQEVEKTTNRIRVVEDEFIGNAKGLFQSADDAIYQLNEAGRTMDAHAQRVKQTLSEVQDGMNTVGGLIADNVAQMEKCVPVTPAPSTPDLLSDASAVLDRLQGFSVDMAHIFTPKSEETLWQRYYEGDKAVFMRHITQKISESQSKKVKDLYRKNNEFKTTVDRYMQEFEEMTKNAGQLSDGQLLMSVLIGSDVGRLYMVLADVLRKKEA